jgi:serine/threonine-protein kinase
MSPEQCRGLEVDRRTDVYAFGTMVFQVLTGEVPFNGDSSMDVLVKHMTAAPPAASARCPDVPVAVDPIIARMMAKEPADRPASLGECIDLLSRAIGDIPLGEAATIPAAAGVMSPLAGYRLDSVPTVIDDGKSMPGSASVRVLAASQSLLGSESDVMPPIVKPLRIAPYVVAAVAAMIAAIVVVVALKSTGKSGGTNASAVPTQEVSSASTEKAAGPSAAALPHPVPIEDVKVRVDGAPAGAVVTADGRELGAAPGPFTMKNGAETKLVVSAKGYRAKEVTVKAAPDLVVTVALDRQAGAGGAKPAGKGKGIHSDLEGFDSK